MKDINVAVVVGSLRQASYNRKVAEVLKQIAPAHIKLNIIEGLGELPLYNEDLDTDTPPETWQTFRQKISQSDAVIFITPEYNRSVPAVIKNAIDVGSRPYGQSVWAQKPTAVLSASLGAIGGFGANHHLRQSLVFLDMPCLQQPEMYLGHIGSSFDENGHASPELNSFLVSFMSKYEKWLATFIR